MKGLSKGRYDETFAGEDGGNLSSAVCEQHRCRPACASAQTVQRLYCYSPPPQDYQRAITPAFFDTQGYHRVSLIYLTSIVA